MNQLQKGDFEEDEWGLFVDTEKIQHTYNNEE